MGVIVEDVSLRCVECGERIPGYTNIFKCPKCGGLLEVLLKEPEWAPRGRGVWRYKSMLPPIPRSPVSMGEGDTPLVRSGIGGNLYLKFEGSNPTGSFKDRGMTVAVTVALYSGAKAVIAASTGNTASSMAAYARRGGLRPIVVLPKGKVARGKLAQSAAYGATIVWVEGSFDDALSAVMKAVEESRGALYPLNSFNPWRLEGQKTLVFEVIEELGWVDAIVYPVGNGGNISAGWKALRELRDLGVIDRLPMLLGVQAEGAAPIADAWEKGLSKPLFYDKPETIATAIRIGRPVNWPKVFMALRDTRGRALKVSDAEILAAQRMLAEKDGILVEPASAASLAGYLKALNHGILKREDTVVLVLTGHGLKDPNSLEMHKTNEVTVEPGVAWKEIVELARTNLQ